MITKIENIPITKTSYPFASAEKYCELSKLGFEETEYYMYGTAHVYQSVDKTENVEIAAEAVPYVNRFIVRAPKNPADWDGYNNFKISFAPTELGIWN